MMPAHPRVGGENSDALLSLASIIGSSPRGRGKPVAGAAVHAAAGLIPAWAGKTMGTDQSRRVRRAHPRVGGENPMAYVMYPLTMGSSPRGRGKPIDTVSH